MAASRLAQVVLLSARSPDVARISEVSFINPFTLPERREVRKIVKSEPPRFLIADGADQFSL